MKAFLIALILSLLLGWVLPFWGTAIIAFLVFLMLGSSAVFRDYLWATLTGILVWGLPATYLYLFSQGKLPIRIAEMFSLPHPALTLAITILIGGIITGLAGATGSAIKSMLQK
ncbi:MAG: hypothetical protein LC115_12535 [Bacteroidia bacterium]|nr:hypothetical protein [Bacteroidia bacterium]